MARGRDSEIEQARIAEGEKLDTRTQGKTGSGAPAHEKEGFGGERNKSPKPGDKGNWGS